jgi:hypothetical protein
MRLRVVLLSLAALSLAAADTLTLRSGRVIQGSYMGGTSRQVRIAVGDRIETYDIRDVEAISFDGGQPTASITPSAPAVAATPAPAAAPTATMPVQITEAAPAAAPQAQAQPARRGGLLKPEPVIAASKPATISGEVPAGTQITIRMIDDVDSQVAQLGQTFRASVDEPVMAGTRTVIPRGAEVVTKLVDMKDPSKLSGGGQLTLDLASVTINGKAVAVESQAVAQQGESRTRDSATVIGGTAALGAIIGAIAGGGRGAAIGAVSGAGAGTAVQVLTQGPRVRVPSETRLTFTLQQPLRIP